MAFFITGTGRLCLAGSQRDSVLPFVFVMDAGQVLADDAQPVELGGDGVVHMAEHAVQLLLGHTKLESTIRYLGVEVDDALALSEQVDL